MMFFGNQLPMFTPPKGSAKYLNMVQAIETFNYIVNIALARFEWEGLPETCKPEVLEKTLLFYGKALFFFDEEIGGYFHTPCTLPGPYNIYYESIVREAFSYDYNKRYTDDNSVIIMANQTMTPDYLHIWTYTPKIADAIRAIDVHMQSLKRPYAVQCPEKQRNTIIRTLNRVTDNEIAVIGEKGMTGDDIKVLNMNVNNHLPEMWTGVQQYYNCVFNALGVENVYSDKRERMVTSEAEGQTNSTRHVLESALSARQNAADLINDMFGLNVSVKAREIDKFKPENLLLEGGMPYVSEDRAISERISYIG